MWWLTDTSGDGHRCSDDGICFVDVSDGGTRLVVVVMLVIVAVVEIVVIGGDGGMVSLNVLTVVVVT